MKVPTLRERIDHYIATAPRSRPWYNSKTRKWEKGWLYVSKRAIMAVFMEHRRARALQAMKELDEKIAREEAPEGRRRARRKNALGGPRCTNSRDHVSPASRMTVATVVLQQCRMAGNGKSLRKKGDSAVPR
jgi:hypothetical protein